MANVVVRNTREHAIHLNVTHKGAVVTQTIPGARENPLDRKEIIHGTAVLDASFVDVVKKHPVANHYFKEGWLQITEDAPKPKVEQK
jgi:hypothetical protein